MEKVGRCVWVEGCACHHQTQKSKGKIWKLSRDKWQILGSCELTCMFCNYAVVLLMWYRIKGGWEASALWVPPSMNLAVKDLNTTHEPRQPKSRKASSVSRLVLVSQLVLKHMPCSRHQLTTILFFQIQTSLFYLLILHSTSPL